MSRSTRGLSLGKYQGGGGAEAPPYDSAQLVKFVKDDLCKLTPDQFSLLIMRSELNTKSFEQTADVVKDSPSSSSGRPSSSSAAAAASAAASGGSKATNPPGRPKKKASGLSGAQQTRIEELRSKLAPLERAYEEAMADVAALREHISNFDYNAAGADPNLWIQEQGELRRLCFLAETAGLAAGAVDDELQKVMDSAGSSEWGLFAPAPLHEKEGRYAFRRPRRPSARDDVAKDDTWWRSTLDANYTPVFFDDDGVEQVPAITAYPLERAVEFFYDYRIRIKALWPMWDFTTLPSYVEFVDKLSAYLRRMRAVHLVERERFRLQLQEFPPAKLTRPLTSAQPRRLRADFYNAAFIERYFGTMPRLVALQAGLLPKFSYWISPFHDPSFMGPEPDFLYDDEDDPAAAAASAAAAAADSDEEQSDDDPGILRLVSDGEVVDSDDSPGYSSDEGAYDLPSASLRFHKQKLKTAVVQEYDGLMHGQSKKEKRSLTLDDFDKNKKMLVEGGEANNHYQNYRDGLQKAKQKRRAVEVPSEIHVNTSIYWSPLKAEFDALVVGTAKLTSIQANDVTERFSELNRMYRHTIDENLRAIDAYLQLAGSHRVGFDATTQACAHYLGFGEEGAVESQNDHDLWGHDKYPEQLQRLIGETGDRALSKFTLERQKKKTEEVFCLRIRLPLWKDPKLDGLLVARWSDGFNLLSVLPDLQGSAAVKKTIYDMFKPIRDAAAAAADTPVAFVPSYDEFFPPGCDPTDETFQSVVGDAPSLDLLGWQSQSAIAVKKWLKDADFSKEHSALISNRAAALSVSEYAMYNTSERLFENRDDDEDDEEEEEEEEVGGRNASLTIDSAKGTIVLCLWDRNEVYGCVRSIVERRVVVSDAADKELLVQETAEDARVQAEAPAVVYDCVDFSARGDADEEKEENYRTMVCDELVERLRTGEMMKAHIDCVLFPNAKTGIVLTVLVQRAVSKPYSGASSLGRSYAQSVYVDITFMPQCAMAYAPSCLPEAMSWLLRRALSFGMMDLNEDMDDRVGMARDPFFRSVRQCLCDARTAYAALSDYQSWTDLGSVISKFVQFGHIQAALEKDFGISVGVKKAAVPLLTAKDPDSSSYGVLYPSVQRLAETEDMAPPDLPDLVECEPPAAAAAAPAAAAAAPAAKKRKTTTRAALKTARRFYLGQMQN